MNEGYKTLQKPLSRALYLLELSGFPLTESGVAVEPEFLANIMEINEEVVEADQNEIKLLEDSVKRSLDDYILTLSILFENEEYEEARNQVAHMKYYSNLLDKIYEKESEYGMYWRKLKSIDNSANFFWFTAVTDIDRSCITSNRESS